MIITVAYPQSWLSWTISVINMTTEVEDFSGAMVEVGTTKLYKYEFTEVSWESYVYTVTMPWYDDYVDSVIYEAWSSWGLTTEEHDKLMGITGGGGYVRNVWLDAQDKKYIKETHEKVLTLANTDLSWIQDILNEIDSQNDIANQNIIDTIKEIETDICNDINKESVATRQLVRQKAKKQEEFIQKQLDSEEKTQEMIENEADEIEEQIEKNLELEADMIENEINSQFEKEADDIESNLS